MSEFDKARERVERKLVKQVIEMGEPFKRPTLSLPSKQKGKTNEIEVTVWVNGEPFEFNFKAKITGNLMASQITHKTLRPIVSGALSTKFVGVE